MINNALYKYKVNKKIFIFYNHQISYMSFLKDKKTTKYILIYLKNIIDYKIGFYNYGIDTYGFRFQKYS